MTKEQAKPKLTAKQEMFVAEYLIDLNATQAAIRAGYSAKTANVIGPENLAKPCIAKAIQEAMDKRSQKIEITAEYVLNTIQETIERCSQKQPILDNQGNPILVETPNGELAQVFKFDSQAVLKGAELLGKHLKLFTDKTEVTGKDGKDLPQSAPILNLTLNK